MTRRRRTTTGLKNLVRVAAASLLQPARFLVLGAGAVVAVSLPSIALPAIVGSVVAALAMSWADINDPDFINKILSPRVDPDLQPVKRLASQVEKLRKRNGEHLYPGVKEDFDDSIATLEKMERIVSELHPDDQGAVEFVIDQVEQVVERLIKLAQKEQLARSFLDTEDESGITKELDRLEKQLESTTDKLASQQLQKAINQKQQQLDNLQQVQVRLQRIDAYIANIKSALESTYSNLTKLRLRDDLALVDEAELLTDSISSIVAEIDDFAELQLDIDPAVTGESKTSKTSLKQTD